LRGFTLHSRKANKRESWEINTLKFNRRIVGKDLQMNIEHTAQQTLPASMAERIAALKQQSEHSVELWQPEIGDRLIGKLIGTQKAVGTYGENFQILVQGENGTIKATWLTVWLKDNLQVQNAMIGDLIALTFLGKKQGRTGREYNAYTLIIGKS
jgi:hypothetical protein